MRLPGRQRHLLDADLELAEGVISGDAAVDAQYRDAEDRAFDLLARQAPVAGDLRRIVASLRMVSDLERGGDLSVHIAEVARRRYPASAVPPALRSTLLEMGQIGERIMTKAGSIIATSDLVLAEQIEQDDDVVDRLHRQLFHVLLEDEWDGQRRSGRRHHAVQPLLRAHRRPCGVGRPPGGHVPGDGFPRAQSRAVPEQSQLGTRHWMQRRLPASGVTASSSKRPAGGDVQPGETRPLGPELEPGRERDLAPVQERLVSRRVTESRSARQSNQSR